MSFTDILGAFLSGLIVFCAQAPDYASSTAKSRGFPAGGVPIWLLTTHSSHQNWRGWKVSRSEAFYLINGFGSEWRPVRSNASCGKAIGRKTLPTAFPQSTIYRLTASGFAHAQ